MLSTVLKSLVNFIPLSFTLPIEAETIEIPITGIGTFTITIPAFSVTIKKA